MRALMLRIRKWYGGRTAFGRAMQHLEQEALPLLVDAPPAFPLWRDNSMVAEIRSPYDVN